MSGIKEQDVNFIDYVHDYGINFKTREIYLYSNNDDEELNLDVTASFIKNLHLLERISNEEPILIHSITGGGDVSAGLAIYDIIKSSPCHITILVHALASSMSSVFLQAADLRVIMENAHLFLHDIDIGGAEGSISTVRSEYQQWLRESETIYNIYTTRCEDGKYFKERKYNRGKIKAYLKRKCQAGMYLTPQEALELGLADGIFNQQYKNINDLLT